MLSVNSPCIISSVIMADMSLVRLKASHMIYLFVRVFHVGTTKVVLKVKRRP